MTNLMVLGIFAFTMNNVIVNRKWRCNDAGCHKFISRGTTSDVNMSAKTCHPYATRLDSTAAYAVDWRN